MSQYDYDWIVVGSGFGGSVSALRLAEKGYKVAVLECGKRFTDKDFPKSTWDVRRYFWAPRLGLRGIFRLSTFKDVSVVSGSGVGGGSLGYANTLYKPPSKFFQDPQWGDLADWESELAPHYHTARRMLGAAPTDFLTPADALLKELAAAFGGIVNGQAWTGNWIHGLGQWYVRPAIVAFVIFVIAAIAETNHPPFDLVEAEQELVGGFHTEYTGIRFAIFFLAEFMNVITMSAIAVTLFLGGPSGPKLGFLDATGTINVWVMPVFWFMLKLLVLLYGTVLIRATLPRLRYDQLMDLGWKYMIEIAFLWLMVSGVVAIGRQEGWNLWIVVPAAAVGAVLVYLVLYASIAKPGELREQEQIR